MVKAEQARLGHGTGYHPRSQRDPADEAFPCVVCLLSNLITLAIPGGSPEGRGTGPAGVSPRSRLPSPEVPHAGTAAAARHFGVIFSVLSRCCRSSDPVKMEQEGNGLKRSFLNPNR